MDTYRVAGSVPGNWLLQNFIDNIQNVDVSKMTLPVSKEQMIAEVRMVRALHYYWALSEFGNIPVVEHVGVGKSCQMVHPQEAFAYIEKEIKESIPDLSEKGDETGMGILQNLLLILYWQSFILNAKAIMGTDHYQDCMNCLRFR